MTLTDRSGAMLEASRTLNPGCRHVQGDMRDLRLDQTFDAVFVHDAVMYLTTEADLARAIETAWVHLRPGGVALFVPDFVRETYAPREHAVGHARGARSVAFAEHVHGAAPTAEYAFRLRDASGVRLVHDRHALGLFADADWRRLLEAQGFEVRVPEPATYVAVRSR